MQGSGPKGDNVLQNRGGNFHPSARPSIGPKGFEGQQEWSEGQLEGSEGQLEVSDAQQEESNARQKINFIRGNQKNLNELMGKNRPNIP